MKRRKSKREFFAKIILPTLLAFALFTITIFAVIIPTLEKNLLDKKRELIKELTNSAWSVFDEYNDKYKLGLISLDSAQTEAVSVIKYLRYGAERKDYFWITDFHPNMIMHPYREELNNTDLSNYKDPSGKKLFVEFSILVKKQGEGFVNYMWQWKDDSTKIVPKLSYVKGYDTWGWIIGTGIYIEDVKNEISELTNNLAYISLAILIILALILTFVGQQSFKIENLRAKAESSLRDSEAKYRALVEASTEGLAMLIDNAYIYCNNTLLTLLGYDATALNTISLDSILCSDESNNSTGAKYFRELKEGKTVNPNTEVTLIRKDGSNLEALLSASDITFNGKKGYTIIVKDISINKKIQDELGQSKIKYQNLFDNINTGSFRVILNSEGTFLEANSAAASILGFGNKTELLSSTLSRLLIKQADLKSLFQKLSEHGSVTNFVVPIKKHSGSNSVVSFTGVKVRDEYENQYYFDGILEDITEQIKLTEERENLIAELQTSLKFLSEPVEKFVRVPSSVDMNTPVNTAAKLMARKKYSAILITSSPETYIGVLTDRDLRERVVAAMVNLNDPVYTIMSSPVISISANSSVFQALMLMEEKNVRHIAVRDISGSITGIISSEELLKVQRHSSSFLHHEIESVESIEDLIQLKSKIPGLFKTLVDGGAKIKNITQILTGIHDSFVEKIIEHFIAENGPPSTNFAFVSLGSTGRKEHTLISDQDNAIIYENTDIDQSTLHYFNKLGEAICNTLNDCGYVYCKGDAMARNPKWCASLETWQNYFHKWIVNSSPQDLIDLSIFFDFRPVYGSTELTNILRDYLFKTADGQAGFMQHLTKNCLSHKPPVGLLGKIIVESKGDHAETFDIKAATLPIIDFARIYAIKNKIASTNTLERLQGILEIGIINKSTYEELTHAYNILLQLRFKHHVKMLRENRQPNNFVNPEELTQIEQNTLKNAFTQIISIQKKLSYDFSGEAL